MSVQTKVEMLIEAARHLTPEEREKLLKALLERQESKPRAHRITEIRGLGKHLWQDIDAQEYVDERDSWDN